jgi:hypothetical protein
MSLDFILKLLRELHATGFLPAIFIMGVILLALSIIQKIGSLIDLTDKQASRLGLLGGMLFLLGFFGFAATLFVNNESTSTQTPSMTNSTSVVPSSVIESAQGAERPTAGPRPSTDSTIGPEDTAGHTGLEEPPTPVPEGDGETGGIMPSDTGRDDTGGSSSPDSTRPGLPQTAGRGDDPSLFIIIVTLVTIVLLSLFVIKRRAARKGPRR